MKRTRIDRLERGVDRVVREMAETVLRRLRDEHGIEGFRQVHELLAAAQAGGRTHIIEALPGGLRTTFEKVAGELDLRIRSG